MDTSSDSASCSDSIGLEDLEWPIGFVRAKPEGDWGIAGRPMVRINRGGIKGAKIRSILAGNGGAPSYPGCVTTYAFSSDSDRSDALESVRSEFGWTSIDPV
jgi:hypothetical protein